MHDLKYISSEEFREAQTAPLAVRQGLREALPTHAEFVAEMARQVVFDAYGEDAYTKGLTVQTTIRKADQEAAYAAVRRGVIDYDHRHGYRGPEAYVRLPEDAAEREAALERLFAETTDGDGLVAAVVTDASATEVKAVLADGEVAEIAGDGLKFVARALGDKAAATTRIRSGAVIRLARDAKGRWEITQMPQAESAFVSLRPQDGAILALVGGWSFERNKFNHVTQAQRQPGSAFKPFIYSAALEKGFTPATIVNDAPFFVPAAQTGSEDWEPKNYDGKFEGPMRIRAALARSKNLVTVRVLQAIGPQYAQDYITRFGFDPKLHPPYLTMGLGAGSATPDADGGRLLGLRQRRLPGRALSDRPDRRRQGERAVRSATRRSRSGRRTRDRPAQRVDHDVAAEGCRARRHGDARALAQPDRPRRQDRHDERERRRLVLRIQRRSGRRVVDRLRPAEDAGIERDGSHRGAPDLDFLHGEGAEGYAGSQPADARGHPRGTDQPRNRPARRRRNHDRVFLSEYPPRRRDDSLVPGKAGKDIRDQLF